MIPADVVTWRKRHGLTRKAAAAATGIGLRSMLRYEDGTMPIPAYVGRALLATDLAKALEGVLVHHDTCSNEGAVVDAGTAAFEALQAWKAETGAAADDA